MIRKAKKMAPNAKIAVVGCYAQLNPKKISEIEEGDLAMLILRTADNLRHIKALYQVFPQAAEAADHAIELILREPVIMDYYG